MKAFLTQNAAYWFEQFHIDGLRLDAVHEMYDSSASSIWKLLQATRQICEGRLGRKCYLIAESDHNNPATVSPLAVGGQGFDMQWLDDFHHALYVLLHPAGKDRYEDFGSIHQLAKAFKEGFVHSGEYVRFRKRRHGSSSAGVPGDSFVVFNQNHDQVGNRPGGERLCQLVDIRRIKLAAAAVLLSPYIPMLFMGEEYADPAPFFYFVSHSEPGLIRAVREGRKEEFSRFPDSDQMPDAQDEATFRRSKLQWDLRKEATHREVWDWHRELIGLRRSLPEFRVFEKSEVEACALTEGTLIVQRQSPGGRSQCFMVLNFLEREVEMPVPQAAAQWTLVLHSQVKQPAPTSLNTGTSLRIEALSVVLYRAGE